MVQPLDFFFFLTKSIIYLFCITENRDILLEIFSFNILWHFTKRQQQFLLIINPSFFFFYNNVWTFLEKFNVSSLKILNLETRTKFISLFHNLWSDVDDNFLLNIFRNSLAGHSIFSACELKFWYHGLKK